MQRKFQDQESIAQNTEKQDHKLQIMDLDLKLEIVELVLNTTSQVQETTLLTVWPVRKD